MQERRRKLAGGCGKGDWGRVLIDELLPTILNYVLRIFCAHSAHGVFECAGHVGFEHSSLWLPCCMLGCLALGIKSS